jgi:hypothetical protein
MVIARSMDFVVACGTIGVLRCKRKGKAATA